MRRTKVVAALALTLGVVVAGCGAEEATPEVDRSSLVVEHLTEELDLAPAQRAHLDRAHGIVTAHREGHMAEREEHFGEARQAVSSGEVNEAEVHAQIDAKTEEMRLLAHQVADELIPFVRSLDEDQRAAAMELMDRFHDRMRAFHDRMESSSGGMGPFARLRAHHGGLGDWFRGE